MSSRRFNTRFHGSRIRQNSERTGHFRILANSATGFVALVAVLFGVASACGAETIYMEDNLVIHNSFDETFDNVARGAASAGSLGAAVPNGGGGIALVTFVPRRPGSGQALYFPAVGFSDLAYNDSALADVAGATGVSFSMWVVHGQAPADQPAWLFSAGSSQGNFGLRVNGNSDEFRACSPGGFFGSGRADKKRWHHIAYTIVPEEGQFRAKFYVDGKLNDVSPQLFEKVEAVKNAGIGKASYGQEWRLNETRIDDFRLYNVGMTDRQIARLASEGGRTATLASSKPAPAALPSSTETPPSKSIAPTQNNEEELGDRLKQPFIIYSRDYTTPCFANYVPTPKEADGSYSLEMAGNEYEPVQIGIYVPSGAGPASNLNIEVDIDIPHESGHLHYNAKGQIWRPIDEGRWYANYPGGRRTMPLYVVPGRTIRHIPPGGSSAYWITFKADEKVSAGIHSGQITISAAGAAPQVVPLNVEVYPFGLPRPDAVFSLFYRVERVAGADVPAEQTPPYRTKAYQQMYADDMAAHGHNSVQIKGFYELFGSDSYQSTGKSPLPKTWPTQREYGNWRHSLELLDPEEYADGNVDPLRLLEEQMRMYQRAGLANADVPMHAGGHFACDNKSRAAETIRNLTIKNDWPEFLFYMRDEPPLWGWDQEQRKNVLEFKRVAHCRGIAALSGPSAIAWGHLHDIWISLVGEITPEMLREAHRQGGEVWTYSDGRYRLTNPLSNRYYTGLYTWGLGLAGNHTYCYQHGDVGAPHPVWQADTEEASRAQILGYIIPGPKGPVPGVGYEGRREGIDDYRYLQLLEARVAAAGTSSDVANEAARWLADLKQRIVRASIRGILGAGYQYHWEMDWVDPQSDIDPAEYPAIRETAARYIDRLPKATGESNAPPSADARQFASSGWEGEPFHDRSLDECLRALEAGSIAEQRGAASALLLRDVDTFDPVNLAACIENLARLLENPEVRIPAMRALRIFGPQAAPALDALKRQLAAEDPWVRCGAIWVMESMGPVALEGLILGLEDSYPMNSGLAAESLGRFGADAARALPALKKAMASEMIRGQQRSLQGAIESIGTDPSTGPTSPTR